MISLATIDSVVGLFKKLIEFKDKNTAKTQLAFERLIQPLFEELTPIAVEYRATIAEVNAGLNEKDVDLHKILLTLRRKRELMVMGRNTLIGLLKGTDVKYRSSPMAENFEQALDDFLDQIQRFFWLDRSETPPDPSSERAFRVSSFSGQTRLIKSLEEATFISPDLPNRDRMIQRLQAETGMAMNMLENQWMRISESYALIRNLVY
jgi:hypothetical protein